MERPSSQRGSAIIMLFIAVALFGILAYAFMQSSRTSTSWLESERGKASATATADCANTLGLAVKRLEARGCTGMISMNADGTNTAPGAPTDGSCSVYHPNGGGAKYCDTGVTPPAQPCGSSPSIGDICSDGTIYAGRTPDGNVEMFITDAGAETYLSFGPTGTDSGLGHCTGAEATCSEGQANTAALATNPANVAALYCENLTANGYNDWYLPARAEVDLLYTMHQGGFGTLQGAWYSTSSQSTDDHIWLVNLSSGAHHFPGFKPNTDYIRCVRKGI